MKSAQPDAIGQLLIGDRVAQIAVDLGLDAEQLPPCESAALARLRMHLRIKRAMNAIHD